MVVQLKIKRPDTRFKGLSWKISSVSWLRKSTGGFIL